MAGRFLSIFRRLCSRSKAVGKVEDIVGVAIELAIWNNSELHTRWVTALHNLAAHTAMGPLLPFSQAVYVDLLLRVLDKERLDRLGKNDTSKALVDGFSMSLSESWISRVYEVLRVARASSKEAFPPALQEVFDQVELVRMAVEKGEVAKGHKKNAPKFELSREDSPESRPYLNDGSYIVPRKICGATGSLMWVCIDLNRHLQVEICRQELSDRLLAALTLPSES